jgi:cytochrome c553
MSFPRVFAFALLFGAGLACAETPDSNVLGDVAAGQGKAAVCGACHGIDGNSANATYPKLAGQNEAYIVRQLGNFKAGKRVNPIMAPFAAALSEQDMHDLGAYFASQQATPGQTDEAYVERAQKLYRAGDSDLGIPACMACHGPSGRGIAGAAYPQLAGQWADYVSTKLTDWRGGTSWGDDDHAKIMPDIAKRLSEADIAALASYAQGLHTSKSLAAE